MDFDFSNISEDHAKFPKAKLIGDIFTLMVDYLRSHFSNKKINEVATLLWDLVGQQIVPTVGIDEELEGLVFALSKENGKESAFIVIPDNWPELVEKDPTKQLGGVVFCASRAKDFFDKNKLDDSVLNRAKSYEAEFLLHVKSVAPEYELDKWQQAIVDEFPEGIK